MYIIEVQEPKFENGQQVGWHEWRRFLGVDSYREAELIARDAQRDNPECNFRIV